MTRAWMIWRVVLARVAPLAEVERWSADDLATVNAALDAQVTK